MKKLGTPALAAMTFFITLAVVAACSATNDRLVTQFTGGSGSGSPTSNGSGLGGANGNGSNGSMGAGLGGGIVLPDATPCAEQCSSDFHSIIDCNGNVITTCSGNQGCDGTTGKCADACTAAVDNKESVGCEYYATYMDVYEQDVCFAAYVANTWTTPVHITVDYNGSTLPVGTFAFIPSGTGPSLTYAPYDSAGGLPPGQVAILFLDGDPNSAVPCPQASAMTGAGLFGTSGIGNSFHITTDVPVVAYQINPFGGGSAAVTGASLLLPTSAWDVNYVGVTVSPQDIASPSMNIIASEDGTVVTMLPTVAVQGGGGLPGGPANTQYSFTLNKGQQAQFSQTADLTGSIIQATHPSRACAGRSASPSAITASRWCRP